MPDEDTGNPWLAIPKTYKGKYQVTPGDGITMASDVVMLSSDNDVTFMGDVLANTYTAGDTLLTLPEDCRPLSNLIRLFPATYEASTGGGEETRHIAFSIPSTTISGNINLVIPAEEIQIDLPVTAGADSLTTNIVVTEKTLTVPAQTITVEQSTVDASLLVPAKTLNGDGTANVTAKTVNLWPESEEKRLISNGSGFAVANYTVAQKDITVPSQTAEVTVSIDDTERTASGTLTVPGQTLTVNGATLKVPEQTIPVSFDVTISGQAATGTLVIPEKTVAVPISLVVPPVDVDTDAVISVPSETGVYTRPVVVYISATGKMSLMDNYTNLILHLMSNSYNIGVNWYR